MWDLAEKGMKYFNAKPDYKKPVRDILDTLTNNKNFISDVTNMIDTKKGIEGDNNDNNQNNDYIKNDNIKS